MKLEEDKEMRINQKGVEDIMVDDNVIKNFADIISKNNNIVVFTGAGVSTESNIPDFRSEDGLYKQKQKYTYRPEQIISHSFWKNRTEIFYDYYFNNMVYKDAKPNYSHVSIAELEKMGKVKAVVTQNIDGLHQNSGSKNVLELHGSVERNYCISCGQYYDLQTILDKGEKIPICEKCSGIIKPDVVLYEEALNQKVMQAAVKAIRQADVLIVMGTSLSVYPAAGLVDYFKGKSLVLINKSTTPYDKKANLIIHEKAGEVMKFVMALI